MKIASETLFYLRFTVASLVLIGLMAFPAWGQNGAQASSNGSGQQSQLNECARYLEKTRAPQFKRTINPHQPNVLIGEEGTEMLIPEDAFVKQDNRPVEGEVLVVFSEYFDQADLIAANLPTVSNGRLLESGGVIHLEALADGEPLKLAAGKSILVNFPGGAADGMQLFSGEYDAQGVMNWVPLSDQPQHLSATTLGGKIAPNGPLPLFSDYGPVDAVTLKFRDKPEFTAPGYIYAMLEKNYTCRGRDAIYLEIFVDAAGRPTQVNSLTGRNNCLRQAVEEAVQTLVFDPKSLGGAEKFFFQVRPEALGFAKGTENRFESIRGRELAVGGAEIEATMAKYMEREKARNFVKNAFAVTQMGFINCDRFASSPRPTVASTIELSDVHLSMNSKVFLVFDGMNSVMEGRPEARGTFRFSGIPIGKSVTVVAMAYDPAVGPYLSTKKAVTTQGSMGTLDYQQVSEARLMRELARL
ncbi:MAG: hypothetical protein AAGN35_11500 [Bacteroidota bacterium]